MAYLGNAPTSVPLSSADILDGAITSAKIANGTITTADLASGVGGKVLQVVSTTKTDTFATNPSSAWIDLTGMSVSITPSSASNKILIQISISGSGVTGTNTAHFRLVRGSTVIYAGNTSGNRSSGFASCIDSDPNSTEHVSGNFLDSPSTTSSTTYKIQTWSNNTVYVNRTSNDIDDGTRSRGASTITVMEIAV
jgi:hypothetical protein